MSSFVVFPTAGRLLCVLLLFTISTIWTTTKTTTVVNAQIITPVVTDSSAPGYIVAESDGGLSNRLRVLFSHMFLAKTLNNNAHIVFIWDVNEACPGHFLSVFEPIENVTFAPSSSKAVLAKGAVQVYNKSRDGFDQTMLNYDVNWIVKKRTWWHIELSYWELLKPRAEVEEIVEKYVADHRVCNITAMHIRKTDLEHELTAKKRSGYQLYYNWIYKQPPQDQVYILTDNPTTQQHFFEMFGGDKIIVYANISSPTGLDVGSYLDNITAVSSVLKKNITSEFRFTSLQHAVIDIFIAAHAWDFRTTPFSSVSDLVKMMNFLHRWHWCECGFKGC